jgi:hypothetical protein
LKSKEGAVKPVSNRLCRIFCVDSICAIFLLFRFSCLGLFYDATHSRFCSEFVICPEVECFMKGIGQIRSLIGSGELEGGRIQGSVPVFFLQLFQGLRDHVASVSETVEPAVGSASEAGIGAVDELAAFVVTDDLCLQRPEGGLLILIALEDVESQRDPFGIH